MKRIFEEAAARRRRREWIDTLVDGALVAVGGAVVVVFCVIGWYHGGF